MPKRVQRGRTRFWLECPKCGKRMTVTVPVVKVADVTGGETAEKWIMRGEIKVKHKPCRHVVVVRVWTMHAAFIDGAEACEAPLV